MSEVKNEVVEQATVQAEESKMKLSKVYDFEGAKVSEIDFSGLENLTANDMIKANKVLNTSGNVTVLPETNLEHTRHRSIRNGLPDRVLQAAYTERCNQSQKQSHKFFLRRGIRIDELSELRKLCLVLSMNLKTGLDYFLDLSFFDLLDLCDDMKEVSQRKS